MRLRRLYEVFADAARGLRRRPGFALAAIGSIALGIGANTAMFTLIDGVVRPPLPFASPASLVTAGMSGPSGLDWDLFLPDISAWRERARTLSVIAVASEYPAVVTGEGAPEQATGAFGSENLLTTLGLAPAKGRWLTADDARQGAARVVVIAHDLWQRQFGGRDDVLGRRLKLYDNAHEIVGVMPKHGALPIGAQFWVPTLGLQGRLVARGQPGVSMDAIGRELAALSPTVANMNRRGRATDVVAMPLREQLYGSSARPVGVLFGAAALMLLIAAANVANLALARSFDRRREWALRISLGASRQSLVGLVIAETAIVAAAGAAAGIMTAFWTVNVFVALAPGDLPLPGGLGVNVTSVLFGGALAVVAAMAVSLAPALAAGRGAVPQPLADGGARHGRGRAARAVRRGLVIAQLATAVVLLSGAGLLVRSMIQLTRVDLGFEPAGVITSKVSLMGERFRDEPRVRQLLGTMVERISALPGVEHVSIGPAPLVAGRTSGLTDGFNLVFNTGPADSSGARTLVWVKYVDDAYLDTFRIPLRAGRGIVRTDDATAPRVALLNAPAAKLFFRDEDPIGRPLAGLPKSLGELTVVGLIRDVRQRDVAVTAEPEIIVPLAQQPARMSSATISARIAGNADATLAGVRNVVREIDPEMATLRLAPMTSIVDESLARYRFLLYLLGAFAVMAIVLATLGVYAVVSYGIRQRTREIGVRLALGATRAHIVGLVGREAAALALIGAGLGVTLAICASGLLAGFLFGVAPRDVLTLVAAPALLVAATAAAAYRPTRHAISIDPASTLRAE